MNELEKTVSFVIPTLNSEGPLSQCLGSIYEQTYPKDKIEVIIVDGGSTDGTIDVATRFHVDRILKNPLRTGEAGKAVGVKFARNQIIALVDSDNILDDPEWVRKMMISFLDPTIVGAEPIRYTHRREDSLVTRYCALVGANDPLTVYFGNFDRFSFLRNQWTGCPVKQVDMGDYVLVELGLGLIPTIGANGFMFRSILLEHIKVGAYLFDIDMVFELTRMNYNRFAKVKVGVTHVFARDVDGFLRKTHRRISQYLFYEKQGLRNYPWKRVGELVFLKTLLRVLLFVPLCLDALRGCKRYVDVAWLFHPLACWIVLLVYSINWCVGVFRQTRTSSLFLG